MNAGNLDWLFILTGVVLGACGILLVAAALFRDRSRGRRRCPGCWYDLTGSPGVTCPECGRGAKSERQLLRTRRHWKRAAIALLLLIAAGGVAAYPTYHRGWKGLIPTTVLAALAPAQNPSPSGALVFRGLTPGVAIVNGVPTLTTGAPPPAAAAVPAAPIPQQLTDEFWSRVDRSRVRSWQARLYFGRYFRQNPVDFGNSLFLPERWPVGEPIKAHVRDVGLGALIGRSVNTYARRPGTTDEVLSFGTIRGAAAPAEEIEVEMRLQLMATVLHREVVMAPISINGTIGTFLDRLDDSATNELVRVALNPRLRWEGSEPILLVNDRSDSPSWRQIKFAILFSADLVAGDEVLASCGGRTDWVRPVWKDWEEVEFAWAPGGRERAAAAGDRLRLVVKGDCAGAGRMYMDAPFGKMAACWAGRLEIGAGGPGGSSSEGEGEGR